ncbi:valine--tRNA ligase [Tistrella bauzanensis]|uniref:Valine--tRNA ligase n=1 Tax=Tistrella bauzanensis TaxID=657419 RepID=A0ABQ1IAN9_9PROT|nr:valine--tRNA ligase [Tistrella bauzanensis]GGB26871.1 valine--tRNA ligase [Tistrella bauzanensis]
MLDKTFRPQDTEAEIYEGWRRSGAFQADTQADGAPFTIMMPPPNVTGSLHIGHALTMTIQDALTRYRRMTGRDALWQPGTDHAGIATQMVVERQLAEQGITRNDVGRDGLIERIWAWKEQSGGRILDQLTRLGASADWPRERFTMDPAFSDAVRKVFVTLHKQGLIYRDKRLVNWDPKLKTAISDLEVEPREVKGHYWHLRYPLADGSGRHIVVATTRPETMLGDTAVAVHPTDERYTDLIGCEVLLPLTGRRIPIVADEYSDPEKGSGAVKITPAHDFNDFEVGRRHDLAMINVLDADGRIVTDAVIPAAYRGLDRFQARERIAADMEAAGLLEAIEPVTHTVPYGDRSGVVIEPWLTDQWYVDAPKLAGPAIEAVESGKTVFVPRQWENTYYDWMRNIQPWCVSRQIWWGHRVPAWYGPDGAVFVEETEAEARAAALAHYGEAVTLSQDTDVLDTWFSSALWPFGTLGWPEQTPELARYYPGDVLVTGFDIIFFWVARMMMMGLHFMGDVPFRTVYIHALVRDEKGQKMSKSKGNVIDPIDLIDKYGADAVRFTLLALAAQGRDVKLAEARVAGYRNFSTKLWNAARFAEMNGAESIEGFDPSAVTHVLNRWIVGETARAVAAVTEGLEAFRFNEAAQAAYRFTWDIVCDWYVELAKPVLQGGDSGAVQAETRATLAWVLDQILLLLHPMMPFMTEQLWATRPGSRVGTAINGQWPALDPKTLSDPAADAEIGWLIEVVSAVRSVRSELNVPPAARVPVLFRAASDVTRARAATHGDAIGRLARAEAVDFVEGEVAGTVETLVSGEVVLLPIASVIDVAVEAKRLDGEIARLDRDITGIDKRLDNPAFVAKAPAEVVEENRERREQAVADRAALVAALARVQAMRQA